MSEQTYKVYCCGEYMSLFIDGRKESSFLTVAKETYERCVSAEGIENTSIHAFDRHGNFSHVVDLKFRPSA